MAAVRRVLNQLWQSNTTHDKPHEQDSSSEPSFEERLDLILPVEYPTLTGTTYLDHAGTTPYARSVIESWTQELTTNLFGNPHSASAASQLSSRRIEDVRLRALRFFHADPADFELVFVANATAAIKLVAEAFRDRRDGFRYLYHVEAHTSLVGVRELATKGSSCLRDESEVDAWLAEAASNSTSGCQLFGYPGQSNMTGLELPLDWCARARTISSKSTQHIYTLFDAASLAATSPLDLSNAETAPDFTALSFYKIFGFPDLGALIVRKQSADVLMQKKYFAGGTVDSVVTSGEPWHVKRSPIHAALEEGTLPFHNILALDHALTGHRRLFGSMRDVARHSHGLAENTRACLVQLHHANHAPACQLYAHAAPAPHGPIIAFNLFDRHGAVVSPMEVEKLAIVRGIQFRTGGLCNPGGIASHLALSPDQIRNHYRLGYRCDGENDVVDGGPTSVIRVSFGATSTQKDLDNLLEFIRDYFVDTSASLSILPCVTNRELEQPNFLVESLSVFPIKSCAAYQIPADQKWPIMAKGLAWDREWCIVHEGTNTALSQKKFPQMALLRPRLDLDKGKLRIAHSCTKHGSVEVSLDDLSSTTMTCTNTCELNGICVGKVKVCNDDIRVHVYTSPNIRAFLSEALGTPCTLARYSTTQTKRHARVGTTRGQSSREIRLSNESPILVINRASVERLNTQIVNFAKLRNRVTGLAIRTSPETFRANIMVRPIDQDIGGGSPFTSDLAYSEDNWSSLLITPSEVTSTSRSTSTHTSIPVPTPVPSNPNASATSTSSLIRLNILAPCRRCQMIGICQTSGVRQQEPFSTLAKTRRRSNIDNANSGGVFFGVHAELAQTREINTSGYDSDDNNSNNNSKANSNTDAEEIPDNNKKAESNTTITEHITARAAATATATAAVEAKPTPRRSSIPSAWIKVGDLVQPCT